jgi:hypothetical protein
MARRAAAEDELGNAEDEAEAVDEDDDNIRAACCIETAAMR